MAIILGAQARHDKRRSRRGTTGIQKRIRDVRGQMTVEFMAAFPVMLVVAVVAINALLFFSECAAFDRLARDAVRIHACSPGYGQSSTQTLANIEQSLQSYFDKDYLETDVSVSVSLMGHSTYTVILQFYPTLFGLGLRSEFLGVSLPPLRHSINFTVDSYKPGVLL